MRWIGLLALLAGCGAAGAANGVTSGAEMIACEDDRWTASLPAGAVVDAFACDASGYCSEQGVEINTDGSHTGRCGGEREAYVVWLAP